MTRITTKLAFAGFTAVLLTAPAARAIDYNWNVLGGGSQTWQTAANWSPNSDFPNGVEDTANLSVPLAGNLNVSIGASNVTLGGLNIGGTGAAVTTEISGTGKLIFSNNDDPDFDDDNDVDGNDFLIWQANLGVGSTNATGDANLDGVVDAADLRAWQFGFAQGGGNRNRFILNSNGAAGTVNTISAPVRSGFLVDATPTYRDEAVEVYGTQGLNFAGGYFVSGAANSLSSFLPDGATLTINGILLQEDNETPPTTNRALSINTTGGATGRVEVPGVISGGSGLTIGATGGNAPLSTVVLSGNNMNTGTTTLNRANLVLASDTALGVGNARLRTGNPANNSGLRVLSDSDTRNVGVQVQIANMLTIAGENSLTLSGPVYQTNNRTLINILPAGETLTLAGTNYTFTANDGATRRFTFDGSGKTVVTGLMSHQRFDTANNVGVDPSPTEINEVVKNGSGALYFNGGTTYTGTTTVNGGNLHFGTFDLPPVGFIRANFGAVGVDTGVLSNFTFLATIAASLAPTAADPNSTGGIMIDDSESAAHFDFTAGDLGSRTAAGARLSLAAPETGLTFTGTITPDTMTNAYRLGGGEGTLTLDAASPQLTGANHVVAVNGGVVQLNDANTYTGTTSAFAKYTSSFTATALVSGPTNNAATNRVYGGTVIGALHLANGGSPSSIGASTSAAANLVIQGSTLRYNGSGATTDRLFTVGTGGATIESSGTGAVNFTNTGNLVMHEPAARPANTTSGNGTLSGMANVEELVIGMGVTGTNVAAAATITGVDYSTNSITVSGNSTATGADNVNFTSIARTLTLGGANAGDNTLRPNIVNGAAATSVVKTGAGKWILTGNNTYTGTTTVNEGTLLVNGTHAGGGAYTVAAGATLGGTGTVGGALTASGVVSPGISAGALAVTGNVAFNAGSTLLVEIGGTGAGLFDELNLTGALTAGGTFDVDFIGGYAPAAGHSFDVLDFASASGSFAFNLPALGGGLVWNTSQLLTTGTLSIGGAGVAIPEPSAFVLALGAALALRVVTRR